MTSKQSTADFILDQLANAGAVRVTRMFGEYALYCDEKVVGLICDDQLFIKYTDKGKDFAVGRYSEGYAYPGAKPSMNVTDTLDDSEFLCTLVRLTADALPRSRVKKKR